MSQPDLPLSEQIKDLPPETQATHRRMLVRGRYERRVSRWWFSQMYKAVDEAPEPERTHDPTPNLQT